MQDNSDILVWVGVLFLGAALANWASQEWLAVMMIFVGACLLGFCEGARRD